jgi:hypothetical protein
VASLNHIIPKKMTTEDKNIELLCHLGSYRMTTGKREKNISNKLGVNKGLQQTYSKRVLKNPMHGL